ncbi:hypothetical protein [Corynebacterium variabile]|uniref:hypothetical protein n=1 Tax=Corynebacterium variabile TaxID=1727 RepID=UPI003FD4882B
MNRAHPVKEVAGALHQLLNENGADIGYRKVERMVRSQWHSDADGVVLDRNDPTASAVIRKLEENK